MPNREQKHHHHSMTGYGRSAVLGEKYRAFVEIRSVNGRFLEIRPKFPRHLVFLEPIVREEVSKVIKRGVVDLTISCYPLEGNVGAAIDTKLATHYSKEIEKLSKSLELSHGINGMSLVKLPGVISSAEEIDLEKEKEIPALIKKALLEALDLVAEHRNREGDKLVRVLSKELDEIQKNRDWIVKHREDINKKYFAKLEGRLKDWSDRKGGVLDENRLSQEILYYLDRSDVAEEVERLAIHVKQCQDALIGSKASSLGKRIDFLAQEIGREINTIGAKSDQVQVAQHVVEMKLAVERIREQAQNLE